MNPGITGKLLVRLVLLSVVVLTPLAAKSGQYWEYTVRPGDTIWSLAEKHTTSVLHWQKIQRINNLPDEPARGIMPGTRLRFPVNILKHQPVPANVRLVRGEAQLVREGAEPSIIASGTELNSGDRILVGEDSNLTIRFADGSELLVLGGSELVMDSLSAYGETGMVDTRVRLLKGRVHGSV